MAGSAAIGLGAVLTRSAAIFDIIKWVGVAYSVYLGVSVLRAARHGNTPSDWDGPTSPLSLVMRTWRATRYEVLVAATNPKAMLLFAAFLPQFLPSSQPGGTPSLVLAAAHIGIEAVSAVGYTVLGAFMRSFDLTARTQQWIDRVTGTTFVGFGGYLAMTERP